MNGLVARFMICILLINITTKIIFLLYLLTHFKDNNTFSGNIPTELEWMREQNIIEGFWCILLITLYYYIWPAIMLHRFHPRLENYQICNLFHQSLNICQTKVKYHSQFYWCCYMVPFTLVSQFSLLVWK